IALTEYKGRVYGYSRTEFIVNDTLFYIVKRVKGTIEGDLCEVKDDEIVAYNFRGKLDKGVKVTSTFRRNRYDSAWHLEGTWKTNATKKYYSVTGRVGLDEENDLTASKIFPHLEELKLADEIAFYKDRIEGTPIVKIVRPEKMIPERAASIDQSSVITPAIATAQPGLRNPEAASITPVTENTVTKNSKTDVELAKEELPVLQKPFSDLPKSDIKNIPATKVSVVPSETTKGIALNSPPAETTAANQTIKEQEKKEQVVSLVSKSTGEKPVHVEVKKEISTPAIAKNIPTRDSLSANAINNPSTPAVNSTQTVSVSSKTTTPGNITPVVEKNKNNTAPVAKNSNKQDKPNYVVRQTKPNNAIQENKKIDIGVNNSTITPKHSQPDQSNIASATKINSTTTNPLPSPETAAPVVKAATPAVPGLEKASINKSADAPVKRTIEDIIAKSSTISGRKSEFSQVVNFKSDSLVLSLYDNGVIDGDTVSVFLNGEVLIAHQGLKSSAIKKTIQVPAGEDEFTLVMFAESLGTLPPNTGLLVIRDGDE
ncbi:MAG: hypothetical protein WBC06_00485, partial [Chitinophagaceae bacterium]